MTLPPGSRVGSYEVIAPLGAGGMGEVYRARDTKLRREVALKILPDAFAKDPDRLARFTREAHLLASLNHPHIAAIHGFEEDGRVGALVLELVEGLTLAERIAAVPMPVEEALGIARQIAEALELVMDLWSTAGAGGFLFRSIGGKAQAVPAGAQFVQTLPVFSPDGRFVAYTSDESRRWEIWVRSHPDEKTVRQISVDGGVEPVWCPCGELFYRRGNRWFAVPISTSPELRWGTPRLAFETDFIDNNGRSYDVSADGKRLLVVKRAEKDAPPTKLHVVSNWLAGLKRPR